VNRGDGGASPLEGRGPAMVRVRAAVLAAVAVPGGCPAGWLTAAVARRLAVADDAGLRRRVEGALGLLMVTGHVEDTESRLVIAAAVRQAV
jgi:hypothetical protein